MSSRPLWCLVSPVIGVVLLDTARCFIEGIHKCCKLSGDLVGKPPKKDRTSIATSNIFDSLPQSHIPQTWCITDTVVSLRCSCVISKGFSTGSIMSRNYTFGQRRLRVLVDMDGVLCDFEGHFLKKYRETYPDEPYIPLEKRTTFYLCDQYEKISPDLPDKVRDIFQTERFFLDLPEIEGGCEALREMAQMEDVDVFICTSPLTYYKYCLEEKTQWVEEHLGHEWLDKIILTKDKTMVAGHLLIDDKPYITGVCQPIPWKHVLFTGPYNLNTELRGRKRLDSWTGDQWRELIVDFTKRV